MINICANCFSNKIFENAWVNICGNERTNLYILQRLLIPVDIEKVAEEFARLVLDEELEQAQDLVMKESEGREDELADWMGTIGIEYGENGNCFVALQCFEAAEKIVKLENIKKEILQNLTIAHNNYASLLRNAKRFEEAEEHYKEALRIDPEYAEANANLGILYFTTNDLDSARYWFEKARSMFEKQRRNFDSKKMEAYADWITARKFWESFSFSKEDTHPNLEKSQEYYLRAATKLKEINLLQPAFFLEFISDAIFISKEYLLSLDSKTLIEMRTTMNKIHENFLPLYKEIKQVFLPDIDLLKAQFICIDTLKKCLNFEDVNIADLHEATDIFSNYNFKEPLQATTALENFTNEFKELREHYETVEEIPKEKEKELLKMVKPFSVYDSVITKKMDKLTSDKYVTPYTELKAIREEVSQVRKELPSIIREEVSPIVKESEAKIISEFIAGFDKYYHELVQELEALTSAQLSKVKEAISRIIEEEIDKIEDQEKKESLWNKKKAYDIARDVISILESVVSIYSVLRTNPEQAVNDAATLISTILSTIREK